MHQIRILCSDYTLEYSNCQENYAKYVNLYKNYTLSQSFIDFSIAIIFYIDIFKENRLCPITRYRKSE